MFELGHKNSAWIFSTLYTFTGYSDGAYPASRVAIGPNGTLYGTTLYGGLIAGVSGAGVVFNLQPPTHVSGRISNPWRETVIYPFGSPPDGGNPWGDLIFDAQGNLYGTTFGGGLHVLRCRGSGSLLFSEAVRKEENSSYVSLNTGGEDLGACFGRCDSHNKVYLGWHFS